MVPADAALRVSKVHRHSGGVGDEKGHEIQGVVLLSAVVLADKTVWTSGSSGRGIGASGFRERDLVSRCPVLVNIEWEFNLAERLFFALDRGIRFAPCHPEPARGQ
jgi:hypothetical protein